MARKLRIQYEGAIYHVMNRGDRREDIFHDDQDRQLFLKTLGEACEKTAWQVHAYCLIARRLRADTTMTWAWIATRLHAGVWRYLANSLGNAKP